MHYNNNNKNMKFIVGHKIEYALGKEAGEAVAEKALKEATEAAGEKALKEATEAAGEKALKEATEKAAKDGIEQVVKEGVTDESSLAKFGEKLGKTTDQIKSTFKKAEDYWDGSSKWVKYGIGSAAALAAFCLLTGKTPAEVLKDAKEAAGEVSDLGSSLLDTLTNLPDTLANMFKIPKEVLWGLLALLIFGILYKIFG